jgi:serine/threonine protein kinase/dipeptidyl aminopeptidase/acylaminoacyl peptidase
MERWQQIESLFREALERDPAERNAWLREACQGDSDLRREVASLLANHQAATDSKPWAAPAGAQLIDKPASLEPGQCLGPYRIECFLAAGGMGQVYLATDTRLHREVAIKVSAARFSERFQREARVIASLNHPNICQLHDVGPNFLVMELVEGPTLADRIRQGALPLDEALTIARQIAEALEAAHEKGRVHRDLKPANIKIRPEGVVKLLDFGLAKAAEEPPSTGDPSDSPTQTISATATGVILGTAAYMSPEQARGAALDKRSDIWSFGVVLYEMLTGQHLFRGETVSDTLAGVLKTDPNWKALPPETPASIRRLLRRCLERDRKRRLSDIADALLEIDEARAEPEAPAVTAAPKPLGRLLPWIVAALLALALPAVWLLRPNPEERLLQLEVSAPPGYTFGTSNIYRYAISPDGSKLAFVATSADGKRSLWVRPLHASAAVRLAGTEGAVGPLWDPTSRWIAFAANGKLQKIEVTGSQPQVLCPTTGGSISGTWSRDGVILFADSSRTIRRVSAAGGVPAQVLPLDESRKENSQIIPQFLPDGRRFLYESFAQQNGLGLGSLDGKSRLLMPNPIVVSYYALSRQGKAYLLFLRGNQLIAQPFDTGTAAVSGEPVPIAEPLERGPTFSASENGVLIFRRGLRGQARLTWFDREGKPIGTAGDAGQILSPRISPDQKSVAFYQSDGMSFDIWLFDGERGNTTRFTSDPDKASFPVWSPDGSRIAYFVRRSNETLVIERPASGMGKETILYRANGNLLFPQSWSRDWLLLAGNSASFYLLPMGSQGSGGERQPISFPEFPAEGLHPSISPDGHWLLYSSTQTGSREVFVESMPEQMGGPVAGFKRMISIGGGTQPAWRADGKEIFYVAADGKMMSVSVDLDGAGLKLRLPKPLFPTRLEFGSFSRQYDVSADGKRFLLAQPLEESTSVPITVIVNWPALLKKEAGAL